jgi:hypothetical protein|tara:strand:- start:2785 stop:3519 length:735 start_codon:yes stop_codon:yes gene_type:complete
MKLPELQAPQFTITLPADGREITYRPFLVKEEKLLLIALESDEAKDTTNAVYQILSNCILTEDVNIYDLAPADVEFLFLNVRMKSVGEVIELKFKHVDEKNNNGDDCDHIQEVELNLADVKVHFPTKKHDGKIILNDSIGMKLKYPTLETISELEDGSDDVENIFKVLNRCIDVIWEGDQVVSASECTGEELDAFIGGFTREQFDLVTKFFESIPRLRHVIKYTCENCNQKETVTLEGIQDFFG